MKTNRPHVRIVLLLALATPLVGCGAPPDLAPGPTAAAPGDGPMSMEPTTKVTGAVTTLPLCTGSTGIWNYCASFISGDIVHDEATGSFWWNSLTCGWSSDGQNNCQIDRTGLEAVGNEQGCSKCDNSAGSWWASIRYYWHRDETPSDADLLDDPDSYANYGGWDADGNGTWRFVQEAYDFHGDVYNSGWFNWRKTIVQKTIYQHNIYGDGVTTTHPLPPQFFNGGTWTSSGRGITLTFPYVGGTEVYSYYTTILEPNNWILGMALVGGPNHTDWFLRDR
jgi:hypothetical protein